MRQWYHKLARLFTNSKKYRRCIAIDETKIKIGNKWHYIWAAIDIETWEILGIMVTDWRTSIDVIKFVRSFLPYCENKSLIKIDRAPWYKWALQRMGLQYEHETFGERNAMKSFPLWRWKLTTLSAIIEILKYAKGCIEHGHEAGGSNNTP